MSDGVFVPARSAALLSRLLDLDRRRVQWRGSDAEVDAVLNAWRQVVMAFTNHQLGQPGFAGETAVASTLKPDAHCDQQLPLSPAKVANLLEITEQAVTKAAREGRLDGLQVAGRWQFSREAVAIYKTNRSTRHGER